MLLTRRNNDSNWMSNFFDDFFDTDWMPRMNGTAPAVNVKENEKQYEMDIAAPGLKKEFCRVDLDDSGNLRVKLENKMEHRQEDKKEHYLRREFSYTNYEQSYVLPDDVERDGISAKVEDGVLHIVMPRKAPETKVQKRIEVG